MYFTLTSVPPSHPSLRPVKPQLRMPHTMGPQSKENQSRDISLYGRLGIEFFEALLAYSPYLLCTHISLHIFTLDLACTLYQKCLFQYNMRYSVQIKSGGKYLKDIDGYLIFLKY